MPTRKLIVGASALVGACLGAPHAQAQSATTLFAGGDTLAAKLYRDVFNCYSDNVHGIYYTSPGNNSTIANYPTTLNVKCPNTQQLDVAEAVAYEPVDSAGLTAFVIGSPPSMGRPANSNPVAYVNAGTTVGASATPYPEIEFAGSDAYLSGAQIAAANAIDGLSGHPNPIFQIPALATPIAIPVGSVTGVKLSLTDVCDLFSGQLNLPGNPNALQTIYVFADPSGTSFIFSEWLSLNCTGVSSQPNGKSYAFTIANGFPSTMPSWSAANVGLTTGSLATITAVSGSGGIANAIGGAGYSVGYLSPNYTSVIGLTYAHVNPAKVNTFAPNITSTNTHLSAITPPPVYDNNIGQELNDRLAAKSVATSGYPIVGYTFIDTYGCYSGTYDGGLIGGAAKGNAVKAALNAIYNSTFGTTATAIINASGFVGLPSNVVSLLTGTGGPLSSTGINGTQCPSGRT